MLFFVVVVFLHDHFLRTSCKKKFKLKFKSIYIFTSFLCLGFLT
jgi:hypothetical protein